MSLKHREKIIALKRNILRNNCANLKEDVKKTLASNKYLTGTLIMAPILVNMLIFKKSFSEGTVSKTKLDKYRKYLDYANQISEYIKKKL